MLVGRNLEDFCGDDKLYTVPSYTQMIYSLSQSSISVYLLER